MEFSIDKYTSLVGYTGSNGVHDYYPLYHIDIDGDGVAGEFYEFNLTPKQIERVVRDAEEEISEAISKALTKRVLDLYKFDHRFSKSVRATLVRQTWSNDYALDAGEYYFDATMALETIPLVYLPPYADMFHDDGWCDYGDDVFRAAVRIGDAEDWDGPFECYVNDDDYDAYINDRIEREYGKKVREEE